MNDLMGLLQLLLFIIQPHNEYVSTETVNVTKIISLETNNYSGTVRGNSSFGMAHGIKDWWGVDWRQRDGIWLTGPGLNAIISANNSAGAAGLTFASLAIRGYTSRTGTMLILIKYSIHFISKNRACKQGR